jgi:prephenate dehydrogenase
MCQRRKNQRGYRKDLVMKVVVIGLGLIGGSFAKDLKRLRPNTKIFGMDANPEHIEKALSIGLVEANASNDAGSTKSLVCESVANHNKRRNFLACHPIAGTEFSGPEAAIENLYKGKTNIICEVEKTAFKLQESALQLFQEMGMRIRYMNAEAHDKHIAYVSHLSHISSFMLGKTVIEKEKNERDIFDMAGSGFESTVRLAKSSPAMWAPIFEQNKENVIETLQEYIQNLESFKKMIADNDFEGVYAEMDNTNKIKQILNGIPLNES